MKAGRFITLEGGEGVGKSTNLEFIWQLLADRQIEVSLTREPGGTAIAEKLRGILLERQDETISEQAELMLIFAARAQHIRHVIQPALHRGQWVVCDRFTDSTYAYQGGGRKLNMEAIAWLEDHMQAGVKPDLTLLLDAPVELGLQRARHRGKPDRFEIEQQAFFERVRTVFLERARANPQRYRIIDASLPLPEVQEQIRQAIDGLLAS